MIQLIYVTLDFTEKQVNYSRNVAYLVQLLIYNLAINGRHKVYFHGHGEVWLTPLLAATFPSVRGNPKSLQLFVHTEVNFLLSPNNGGDWSGQCENFVELSRWSVPFEDAEFLGLSRGKQKKLLVSSFFWLPNNKGMNRGGREFDCCDVRTEDGDELGKRVAERWLLDHKIPRFGVWTWSCKVADLLPGSWLASGILPYGRFNKVSRLCETFWPWKILCITAVLTIGLSELVWILGKTRRGKHRLSGGGRVGDSSTENGVWNLCTSWPCKTFWNLTGSTKSEISIKYVKI